MRDENGGDWFQEFLKTMAYPNSQPTSVQEILESITNTRSATVEGVIQNYRDQVGLDIISSDEDGQIKTASVKERPLSKRDSNTRYLSTRHAGMGPVITVMPKLKENNKLLKSIDSFCEHSGGTKNTPSIINHLREMLGTDLVSYTDKELKDYIEERKKHFNEDDDQDDYEVGLVGQDKAEDYDDDIADYQTYNGAK